MLRRVLLALLLTTTLVACNKTETPEAGTAPVAAPAATAAATPEAPATPTPAAATTEPAHAADDGHGHAATPAPAMPTGEPPRLGTDYEVLEAPQPTWGRGKIEVAEVFGYTCIHCAHLQPELDAWHKRLPADVRFEYVPAVFGGAWDTFARAYFAADLLGVREKTHNPVFDALHVKRSIKEGTDEEVADLYATMGVDRARFLAAMSSFGVNAKLAKARQFATRTNITATPTIIVNGKYKVMSTPDRGFPGMLSTVDYLVALERAGQSAGAP